MEKIKTPRGVFKVQKEFETVQDARKEGYFEYFQNDDGKHILTKHISVNSCLFATAKRYS